MLDKDGKMVLEFLGECRNHKLIQDELFEVEETMYSNLYKVEELLSKTQEGRELFIELEQNIFDTLHEMRKTYFEYGQLHGSLVETQPLENLIAG